MESTHHIHPNIMENRFSSAHYALIQSELLTVFMFLLLLDIFLKPLICNLQKKIYL